MLYIEMMMILEMKQSSEYFLLELMNSIYIYVCMCVASEFIA